MSTAAPIAVFCYRRPDHLRQTLEALAANHGAGDHDVVVYADGPRRPEHAEAVAATRAVAHQQAAAGRFRSVRVVEREHNLGLARSIIAGVTEQAAAHGEVIVVEDDLVTSPHFLAFMRDGLRVYRDDASVASIHGYAHDAGVPMPETYFLRGADCWGWATWDRAWRRFDPDGPGLLRRLEDAGATKAFDLDGGMPFTQMLRDQSAGRNDSWAIRWHASAFLAGMYTLHPGRSLVANIGQDDSGEHCAGTDRMPSTLTTDPVPVLRQPVAEHADARRVLGNHMRRQNSLLRRLSGRIRFRLARLLKGG